MDSFTVLCVNDHPQALELRRATLQSHGYSVKTASSGYAAIRILEGTSVSTVLLEYKQEGMDAEAIACHIKQRFPNMPIRPRFSVLRDAAPGSVASRRIRDEERTARRVGAGHRTSDALVRDHAEF